MREEAGDRDFLLIELLDERDQHKRDWWMQEANRRDEIMFRQIFLVVKDAHHGPNESSTSRPDLPNPPT